ncbi:Pyruvate decarboxylase 2 [Hordeum vulgare]|nr:Pyruvate decarboxylase 2 [Hordeum vulgare]
MGLSAIVVLPDAKSSFLPPVDMHNTIPCPQPDGHRKASVSNMDDAREQIGTAISTTLKEIKPISISINWNLPLTCILVLSFFSPEPVKPDEPQRN